MELTVGQVLVILGYALAFSCGAHALMTKRRDPTAAMAWILVCFVLPLLGALLYLTVGQERVHRKRTFRLRMAAAVFRARLSGARALDERIHRGDDVPHRRFLEALIGAPLAGGNSLELLIDGDAAYPEMLAAIAEARRSVNVQFYIFDDDRTGITFQRALMERARAGIEVRVLYDAIGCKPTDGEFFEEMVAAGVQVSPFMPLSPLRGRWRINLRNHRKLVIVDGRVGFTGSTNLSARHLIKKGGSSHDLSVRIEGPAVAFLQRSFARDWHFGQGEDLSTHEMFAPPEPAGDTVIGVVESGPDKDQGDLHKILVSAIHRARTSITLITPYFVPDTSLLDALRTVAMRGLDVRLVVPKKTDSFLINLAVPNYLQPAMAAGVRVYERPGPMLHMKLAIIDDDLTVMGSSNLDNRSFFLNFELDLAIPGAKIAARFRDVAETEMAASTIVSVLRDLRPRFGRRLMTRLAALFAPIL